MPQCVRSNSRLSKFDCTAVRNQTQLAGWVFLRLNLNFSSDMSIVKSRDTACGQSGHEVQNIFKRCFQAQDYVRLKRFNEHMRVG